jgi:hypothetical protein
MPAAAFALAGRLGVPWALAPKRGQAKSQGVKSGADPNWTAQLSCLPVIIPDEREKGWEASALNPARRLARAKCEIRFQWRNREIV